MQTNREKRLSASRHFFLPKKIVSTDHYSLYFSIKFFNRIFERFFTFFSNSIASDLVDFLITKDFFPRVKWFGKTFVTIIMPENARLEIISLTNIKFVKFCRINNINKIQFLKNIKGLKLLCSRPF